MTTQPETKHSRFAPGSGAYRCAECGKLTRDTGEGGACRNCSAAAEKENAISDGSLPEERKYATILERLQAMGFQVEEPIYTLTWQDVAQVMAETADCNVNAPTEILTHALNTIREGLEYLDWYENILSSLRLAQRDAPDPDRDDEGPLTEQSENASRLGDDSWLEAAFEDRICGFDE